MEEPEKDARRSELGATLVAGVAVVLILVMGSPCICYLGAGFFVGLKQFQSGEYNNPARTRKKKYTRDPKYDRKFPRPAERQ